MKYIDADLLRQEIAREVEHWKEKTANHYTIEAEARWSEANYILGIFDSLQQEQQEDPELVRHPPITYTYPSDASRDEQLKRALLALLGSDLIKVAGRKFTKQDLIDWVEKQKPVAWSEEDEAMLEYVIDDVNDAKQLFATKEAIDLCDKEIAWLKSLRPSWKPSEEQSIKED